MIYSIIRSKGVFYRLTSLPEDSYQLNQPRTRPKQLIQQISEAGGVSPREGATVAKDEGSQIVTVQMLICTCMMVLCNIYYTKRLLKLNVIPLTV